VIKARAGIIFAPLMEQRIFVHLKDLQLVLVDLIVGKIEKTFWELLKT
jgi:hypothetical protein